MGGPVLITEMHDQDSSSSREPPVKENRRLMGE